MDGTDSLVFDAGCLFWNVNIPLIMAWKNTIIVQYYCIFLGITCFLYIFATWISAICQVKILYTLHWSSISVCYNISHYDISSLDIVRLCDFDKNSNNYWFSYISIYLSLSLFFSLILTYTRFFSLFLIQVYNSNDYYY